MGAQALIALATVLQANASLEHYIASDSAVHAVTVSASSYGDIVQHMTKAIRLNTGLVHLSLCKFAISDEHMILLSSAVKANHTMQELNLSR